MPTGSAMARATPIENTVSMSVVGIRSSTRAEADWPWWKNDLPKLPVTALPTKRTNWTGSGSCRPSVRRRTARSASGASGMMSDTGSPLACRIANVTSETPVITTARRTSRRTRNEDILSQRGRDGPSDTSHGLGAGKAGARTRIRPLALKLGAETAPPTPPHGLGAGGAGARTRIRPLALKLGAETAPPTPPHGLGAGKAGARTRIRPLALKLGAETAPPTPPHGLGAGKAGARTRIRPLALKLGAEPAPPPPPDRLGGGRAGARARIRPA